MTSLFSKIAANSSDSCLSCQSDSTMPSNKVESIMDSDPSIFHTLETTSTSPDNKNEEVKRRIGYALSLPSDPIHRDKTIVMFPAMSGCSMIVQSLYRAGALDSLQANVLVVDRPLAGVTSDVPFHTNDSDENVTGGDVPRRRHLPPENDTCNVSNAMHKMC